MPYRSPYAGRLADLLMQQGQIAAQRAEASGDVWAGVARGLGSIPAQMQAHKLAEADRANKQRLFESQMANAGLQRQQITGEIEDRTRQRKYEDEARALATRTRQVTEWLGDVASAPDPETQKTAYREGRDKLLSSGALTTQDAPDFFPGQSWVKSRMAMLLPAAERFKQLFPESEKPIEHDPTKALIRPTTGEVVIPAGPPKPEVVHSQESAFLLDGKPVKGDYVPGSGGQPGKYFYQGQDVTGRASVIPPASVQYPKPDDEAPSLTPAGRDAAAQMFAKTGQLPPMGMGKQGAKVRADIINRAAELYPDLDLATNKADFTANQDALKKLQTQRDAIGAFEQTAQKNIDVFLKSAENVADTGIPLLNRPVRSIAGKVFGSSDQAAYEAARQVAINEIAKITSNPNLSGTLSDSARHEVEAFNPQNATLKQTVAVMKLLKQDMENRTTALDDQIGAIKKRIGGQKSSGEGAREFDYDPATGQLVPRGR